MSMRQIDYKKRKQYAVDALSRVLTELELEREDRVNSKDIMQQLDKQSKDIAEMTGMVEMLFKMVKELHASR